MVHINAMGEIETLSLAYIKSSYNQIKYTHGMANRPSEQEVCFEHVHKDISCLKLAPETSLAPALLVLTLQIVCKMRLLKPVSDILRAQLRYGRCLP